MPTDSIDAPPALLAEARAVLLRNDGAEGRTVPARGLYPHQWNWDSALIALGWATFDHDRAWREFESLLAAQHAGGMVAHIAFAREPGEYLPGPDWWGELAGGDGRRTSGITQPAVAATCLRLLFERAPDEPRLQPLLVRLDRWHAWLVTDRDPLGVGEPVVIHPWETGRDNAVEWDGALDRTPETDAAFERADIGFVEEAHRPTKAHYRHYLGLVEWCRDRGWDQHELAASCPFRVLDPAFTALLAQSCADLAWLAEQVGEAATAARNRARASRLVESLEARAAADGSVYSVDLVADAPIERVSCGLVLAASAPGIAPAVRERARSLVLDGELASESGLLSTGRDDPEFAPANYWRGPTWANITWLAALALERTGDHAAATELRRRLVRFVEAAGMREYAHPDSGDGLGARDFSWTAALLLEVAASRQSCRADMALDPQ